MATFTFNIAKGRGVEYYNRVKNNDPAASAFILVPLSASGVQATIQDLDDLAAVLAGGATAAGASWGRKTLTDVELAAFPAPDDVNDRYGVAVPVVTWAGPTTGQNTTGLLICYDNDTAAGTDANIIPITHHDFAVTADGNAVQINAGDFLRAS